MKPLPAFAIAVLCAGACMTAASRSTPAADEKQTLLGVDGAIFATGSSAVRVNDGMLDPNFTWTDSSGNSRTKPEILRAANTGKGLSRELQSGYGMGKAHVDGRIGVIQEISGKLYFLRVWVKRDSSWQLLIYQAVASGAPPSTEPGDGKCDNPCNSVPFEPQNQDQRDVIHAYQAVERAVTAHDSAAWGSHIAGEFFAVTSNSDRPLDKAARMAGLDNQKVAGIAPFPLVSARMFQFGDAVVMTSRQQPEHGLPLHVTRVWFKRHGAWLEAYSYQTTIQAGRSSR